MSNAVKVSSLKILLLAALILGAAFAISRAHGADMYEVLVDDLKSQDNVSLSCLELKSTIDALESRQSVANKEASAKLEGISGAWVLLFTDKSDYVNWERSHKMNSVLTLNARKKVLDAFTRLNCKARVREIQEQLKAGQIEGNGTPNCCSKENRSCC